MAWICNHCQILDDWLMLRILRACFFQRNAQQKWLPMSNKWIKLSMSAIKQFYPKNYRNFVWTFPNIVVDPKWLPSTEFKFLTKKLHNFHKDQSFWSRTKRVGLLKNKFEPRQGLGIIDFYLIWTGLMGRLIFGHWFLSHMDRANGQIDIR